MFGGLLTAGDIGVVGAGRKVEYGEGLPSRGRRSYSADQETQQGARRTPGGDVGWCPFRNGKHGKHRFCTEAGKCKDRDETSASTCFADTRWKHAAHISIYGQPTYRSLRSNEWTFPPKLTRHCAWFSYSAALPAYVQLSRLQRSVRAVNRRPPSAPTVTCNSALVRSTIVAHTSR